jgi:probable phosphoglycerate mutase
MSELWLVRHGETEWSLSGAHTGRTDIALTAAGKEQARALGRRLAGREFALVLTSPLSRARETCALAGFAEQARVEPDLREWDYGAYEGRTTPQIRAERPEWCLWRDGVPDGEALGGVAARAQAVIGKAAAADGDALLFSHGHLLRILAACWLGLPPDAGRLLALGTASLGTLGYERETRVITRWNLSASE